ncbi:MAG: DUF4295 domain-containing protein [Balneolaceae bacterium]
MAKQQAFGEHAQKLKATHRKMAKVIITSKNARGQFAYKEAMVDQDTVTDFIKQYKS